MKDFFRATCTRTTCRNFITYKYWSATIRVRVASDRKGKSEISSAQPTSFLLCFEWEIHSKEFNDWMKKRVKRVSNYYNFQTTNRVELSTFELLQRFFSSREEKKEYGYGIL